MNTDEVIKALAFQKPWREYQERVLRAMELHLADGKLHVVAAPGAGKTVLGLEAFRRLGKPALALSPTRNIRDQWLARLRDFVPTGAAWPPPWAGTDLKKPGTFTSVTYQALHTASRKIEKEDEQDEPDRPDATAPDEPPTEKEIKELVKNLKQAGIGALILDEAHHLRAEWWKALTSIAEHMDGLTLVSLTATPPYDVTGSEWENYQELCGPIDEEISAPELVKAGTLCPHQDYVWMVKPSESDRDLLRRYDESVDRFCADLLGDGVFRGILQAHPWVAAPEPAADEVLETPAVAVAMLVYLRAAGAELPNGLLRLLDSDPEDIPAPSRRWWQILVRSYLFDAHWPATEECQAHRERLAKRLRAEALLWRRELRLDESRPVKMKLSLSPAKIQACREIYRQEAAFRGDTLRQVILADFIRDDDLGQPAPASAPTLGAWPVFRELARKTPAAENRFMGLLTGRLAVIHASLLPDLRGLRGGADPAATELPALPGFVRLDPACGPLTEAFTALLTAGKLRVLVGTRSLLGEGWDAPVVNSLVLCSFVGSFMLTNQMRGRAIRIDRARPAKSSSVWHLVAVEPKTRAGLSDVEDLQRRFETFVGLAADKPVIENGLDRMALDFFRNGRIAAAGLDPEANNRVAAQRLLASGSLARQWAAAIEAGAEGRVIPTVSAPDPPRVQPFHFMNTLRYLLYQALSTFLVTAGYIIQGGEGARNWRTLLWLLIIAAGAGFIVALPKLFKALFLLVRHLPVDGAIRQIALALRDALCAARIIEDSPARVPVITEAHEDGSCSVALGGADFYRQSLFADCLGETLGAIENPRYLVTRRSLSRWFGRLDYHAVPQVLAVKKELAELFLQAWQRRVGPAELIYTRSPETRRVLLKARARAFSSVIAKPARRLDRWQ